MIPPRISCLSEGNKAPLLLTIPAFPNHLLLLGIAIPGCLFLQVLWFSPKSLFPPFFGYPRRQRNRSPWSSLSLQTGCMKKFVFGLKAAAVKGLSGPICLLFNRLSEVKVKVHDALSDSLWPHGLSPWNSQSQSAAGRVFHSPGIFPTDCWTHPWLQMILSKLSHNLSPRPQGKQWVHFLKTLIWISVKKREGVVSNFNTDLLFNLEGWLSRSVYLLYSWRKTLDVVRRHADQLAERWTRTLCCG